MAEVTSIPTTIVCSCKTSGNDVRSNSSYSAVTLILFTTRITSSLTSANLFDLTITEIFLELTLGSLPEKHHF